MFATINFHKIDFSIVAEIVGILIAALVVRWVVRRSLKRFLRRVSTPPRAPGLRVPSEEQLARQQRRADTVSSLLISVSSFFIWIIALLMIMAALGINLAPILAGATVAGAGLAIGAQSLVRDVLAGVSMLAENQFGIGDTIDVVDLRGTVEDIGLRTTRIRTDDGLWFVPNGEIKRLGNISTQSS